MGHAATYKAKLTLVRKDRTEKLLSVNNDIYYRDIEYDEDDEPIYVPGDRNERSETFFVTQQFIDSLKPGDQLVLEGEGTTW